MNRFRARIAAGAAAVLGLVLVVLATRSQRTHDISSRKVPYRPPAPPPVQHVQGTLPPPSGSPSRPAGTGGSLPNWIMIVFFVIVGILLLVLATSVVIRVVQAVRGTSWRDRDRLPDNPDSELSPADVARKLEEAVDEVLIQIERGETNEAIIACWMRLEDVAADAGTERRPAETSAELAERVLSEHQVTAAPMSRLAELYREARFSAHTLQDSARDEAREALERIRDELRTGVLR